MFILGLILSAVSASINFPIVSMPILFVISSILAGLFAVFVLYFFWFTRQFAYIFFVTILYYLFF
jgi:hypothetical protein